MRHSFSLALLPLLCTILLSAQTISCPALSNDTSESAETNPPKTVTNEARVSVRLPRSDSAPPLLAGQQIIEMRLELPDVHFWTSGDGTPQLDYRAARSNCARVSINENAPASANIYGGAVNRGMWRGFAVDAGGHSSVNFVNYGSIVNLGPDIAPQIIAFERQAINYDDATAAAGKSSIAGIQLNGSGIYWGPESSQKARRPKLWERMVTSDPCNHQSCLLGPVRLTADYIRFDGPVSRIGTDVTLNARRIVIDGVELPASTWRQALTKIVQSATQPNEP